jgi:hypothetical protein
VVAASVILGGNAWLGLPKMFSLLNEETVDELVPAVESWIQTIHGEQCARWITFNIKHLEKQTFLLVQYFLKERVIDPAFILTLSLIVSVEQSIEAFTAFACSLQ